MMKPNWTTAPQWANYLVQEADGTWYWHEEKPWWEDNAWWHINTSRTQQASYDAENSLEARP